MLSWLTFMWYDIYMKKIIQFNVEKGEKYYVAHSADIPVVTQALTLDELTTNIKEATELYFEGEETSTTFAPVRSLLLNFEIPENNYAKA